ncbi:unnamed protein product [Mytilus edulis]|uniref:Ig-like domain-containing protein n=1 Tax=Mytilus edulis TaxID=6550 RepID=A0A8S3QSE9_MYTED|nr:unnamed protein product [Mytilus edulis]
MNDINVVNGINIYMNDNITASAGEDDIEIKCAYTCRHRDYSFGEYLRGRVTMTNITQESTEATTILNELKCTDQNQYRCKVTYLNKDNEVDSEISLPTTIIVTAKERKPHISNFTRKTIKLRSILTNMTNDVINRTEIYREGDIVTFVCTGNVGRPPGNILWQKMYLHEIKSLTYDKETVQQTEAFYWECSFNITSYFTIQLSANDFNARIRCVVVSPYGNGSLYVNTVPLNFHFGVRHVFINILPERQIFDTTINNITLMCNGDGNPKPTYTWYKRKNKNNILSTSNKYVINDVIQNNSGTYICEVYNFISGETYTASTSVKIAIIENTENGEHSSRNDSNTEGKQTLILKN